MAARVSITGYHLNLDWLNFPTLPQLVLILSILSVAYAQQVISNPNQVTLQQLLAQYGLKNDQVALIMIAPRNAVSTQQGLLQYIQGSLGVSGASAFGSNGPVTVTSPAQPIDVHYKSQSAPLNVQHTHIPAPKPELKLSRSEEEPHTVVHEIIRPVVQEVREIIQPYRRIVQEIRPVQESIVTQVAGRKPGQAGQRQPGRH